MSAVAVWTRRGGAPLVVAHRGGALLAAENTAQAFDAARTAGADAVETDIRRSADGVLVCVHDADLLRLCGDPRRIEDLELASLRALLPGLLTLDEAIAASRPLGLLLDLKLTKTAVLPAVVAALARQDGLARTLLGLREIGLLAPARALAPDLALLAFAADPDAAAQARAAGADWFRLWQGAATPQRAKAVRRAGLGLAIMVGQPRAAALPEEPHFPVGRIDRAGLGRVLALAPDAVLLDDPRLLSVT